MNRENFWIKLITIEAIFDWIQLDKIFNQSTSISQETTQTYYCALVRLTTTQEVDVNQALTALLDPQHQ